jgi:hypothetical protein
MSRREGILVLTSCTATKADADSAPLAAEDLYTGQQHVRLMRGVRAYRAAGEPNGPIDLRVLSAGHGVIEAATRLATYDETFSGLTRGEVRRRGEALGVPADVAALLSRPRNLILLVLGDLYLHSAALSDDLRLGGPTIALTSPRAGARLPAIPRLTVVPLHNREARRFSCGLTALKGDLAHRLLDRLIETPVADVPHSAEALLTWLEASISHSTQQLSFAA